MSYARRLVAVGVAGALCGCAALAVSEWQRAPATSSADDAAEADLIEKILRCEVLGGVPTGRVAIVEHDDTVTCATPRPNNQAHKWQSDRRQEPRR